MKFNLPVHFKNLTVLSMATLMLGMGHPLELNTVELASTARTAVMASKMAKTLKPKEAQAKTPDKKATPAATKKTAKTQEKSAAKESKNTDATPVIASAINKIDKAQKVSEMMGGTDKDKNSNANCKECSTKQAADDMKYGSCTDKNDYLEGILEKHSSNNTATGKLINQAISPNGIIKPTCMEMSIELGRGQFRDERFKTCNGEKIAGMGKKSSQDVGVGSPCGSQKYISMVTNSFNLVATCMKDYIASNESDNAKNLDVLAVYSMINIESGFITNTVSRSGAAGIGQFTSVAIDEVNTNELADVKTLLENHATPACRDLSSNFLNGEAPIRAEGSKSCDRISIEKGNPIKNMIYTFAYLKSTKDDLDRRIFNNEKMKAKFKNLTASDIQKIRRVMMIWSHNTGSSGITDPVRSLLKSKYKNALVTSADKFISQIDYALRAWPASGNKSSARITETTQYYPRIAKRLAEIEQNAGGGSCLN